MCKLPLITALGLCLLFFTGCQTPLFSDGLFSSLKPKQTLTVRSEASESHQIASTSKPHVGGRGWRNAASRAAEKESQLPVARINNVNRLRQFLADGNDAMQKGLIDDARIQYETVLSIEPQHATAHHMLGRISDMDRKFDEAERHYLEALSANREDGYLLSDLGYSYLQQGRLAEARQYLTRAITLEPELSIAKINLAAVYAYSGDERGALAWLRKVGTEQQAQETLASIVSKPAPYVYNGAAGALASGPDQYTITPDGKVLGKDGKPLTSWEEIQSAMAELREQGGKKRMYEEELKEFQENERIKHAMAQETGSIAAGSRSGNDANLNGQMRDIARASGTQRQGQGNTRPIYVGPTADNNRVRQALPGNNVTNAPQNTWNNPQQQFPNVSPASQDQYSGLLNPAGPTGFQGQPGSPAHPGYPAMQVPQSQPGNQGYVPAPQFPGVAPVGASSQGPGALMPQNQYANPGYGTAQRQGQLPRQNGTVPSSSGSLQGQPPLHLQQAVGGARGPVGNPPPGQLSGQQGPSWNGQPGNIQQMPRSTAPNPAYFGQRNTQGNVTPQTGMSLSNQQVDRSQPAANSARQPGQFSNGPASYSQRQPAPGSSARQANGLSGAQQPIQQLGYNSRQPQASIHRGRPMQQYSQADRQAMQLGMAAGFGGLAPIDPNQNQPRPQNNVRQDSGVYQQAYRGIPNGVSPGGSYSRQPGQVPQSGQQPYGQSPQTRQLPNRGYPGSTSPPNGQIPGQANIWAPGTPAHGQPANGEPVAEQTIADRSRPNPQVNPQTAEQWRGMPASQAGTTMPVAFSNSTQPLEQQSRNWSQPGQRASSWQNEALSSPTTHSDFGRPHMTDPYLRQAEAQTGRQSDGQTIHTASWDDR